MWAPFKFYSETAKKVENARKHGSTRLKYALEKLQIDSM